MTHYKKLVKYLIYWTIVLLGCVLTGFFLLIITAKIPQRELQPNLIKSSEYLKDSPRVDFPGRLTRDNFTDALMLHLASTIDEHEPVKSIIINKFHWIKNPEYNLYHLHKYGKQTMRETSYFRYWHGYLVILRPILLFFDYQSIRYVNYVIFNSLIILLLYLIRKHFKTSIMLAHLVALTYGSFFWVPQSIQFSTTFYISVLSCIYIIIGNWKNKGSLFLSCIFVTIGAITSYADFLVTPIITLAFPLLFTLLQSNYNKNTQQLKTIALSTSAWFFGYLFMWVSKWILFVIITDLEASNILLSKLGERSIGSIPLSALKSLILYTFWFLPDWGISWWVFVIAAVLCASFIVIKHLYIWNRVAFVHHIGYLIIALMPLAWLMFTFNHTIIHIFFTHRIWSISIFSLLIFAIKVKSEHHLIYAKRKTGQE